MVAADLRGPAWTGALPRQDYDAVLTATALHWLPEDRLAALYGEIRQVLRPGGVFLNADHMPDEGLPTLTERMEDRERSVRESRYATGAVLSWDAWWDRVAKDGTLGPLLDQRRAVFAEGGHTESTPPVTWHVQALRAAGYTEAGIVWRGATDAAVAGVR